MLRVVSRRAAAVLFTPTIRASSIAARSLSTSAMSKQADNVYETQKYVEEYLAFHYGQDQPFYMPYADGPRAAVDFNVRIADKCSQLLKLQPKAAGPRRALDVGCAVGRACFELARDFDEVVGIDFSHAFVDCCNDLKAKGSKGYRCLEEGENYSQHTATVDTALAVKCHFEQGDACKLNKQLGQFDVVLLANLICRLPEPMDCLNDMKHFVKKGGHLVITSPFSWLEQFTDKNKWLGGTAERPESRDGLVAALTGDGSFSLQEEGAIPFMIREHRRKYQLVFPHLSVFVRQ